MSKPLTYQSLRCVLEYLDANMRIHISARIPSLLNLEKSLPLHLDQLCVGPSSIKLNDISYDLYTVVKENKDAVPHALDENGYQDRSADHCLMYGDVRMSSSTYSRPLTRSDEWKRSRSNLRPVRKQTEFHVVMKCLTYNLLKKGRKSGIYVRELNICGGSGDVLRLPRGMKLHIQQLTTSLDILEFVQPIINGASLTKINISKESHDDPAPFQLPFVQNAQKLEIKEILPGNFSYWRQAFLNLPNPEIQYKCGFLSSDIIIDFVQSLIDDGRELGRCYTFEYLGADSSREIFPVLERRYNKKAKVVSVKRDKHTPSDISYSIYLPMTLTTELLVSFKQINSLIDNVKMEVVPIGTSKQETNFRNVSTSFWSRMLSCVRFRPRNRTNSD